MGNINMEASNENTNPTRRHKEEKKENKKTVELGVVANTGRTESIEKLGVKLKLDSETLKE